MEEKEKYITKECKHHGYTLFVLEGRGYYRCKICRWQSVSKRRRKVKAMLVSEAGGCCSVCGYDKHPGVLDFHHIDRETKSFGLAQKGLTPGIKLLREEAAKCVLLCANCHREVELGLIIISCGETGITRSC